MNYNKKTYSMAWRQKTNPFFISRSNVVNQIICLVFPSCKSRDNDALSNQFNNISKI